MLWPFFTRTGFTKSGAAANADTSSSSLASTRFASKLFHELIRTGNARTGDEPPGDAQAEGPANVFFSSASILLCLAMVLELASGETRDAMAQTLELAGLAPSDIEKEIVGLKSAFDARAHAEVALANALWLSVHARVAPELLARLRALYNSELASIDFASVNAAALINQWVNTKTRGKIGHIVDRVSPLSALAAMNAVYFKGAWMKQFQRGRTQDRLFTTGDGQVKQLPTMQQSGNYAYLENRQMQMVVLPYKGGFSMTIVLPAAGTEPAKFQAALTSGAWDGWRAQLKLTDGTILLPRFKLDYDMELKPTLAALGMARAFDLNLAEFGQVESNDPSGVRLPLWIDRVIHRAVVDVNEEGTEAAAATVVLAPRSAMISNPELHFFMRIDHPFLVAIVEDVTKTILFMGWVGDPG
jgi:serine protease inhibitor